MALVACIKNAKEEAEAAGAKPLDSAGLKAQYAGNSLVGSLPDLETMRRGLETEPQVLTVFFSEDGRLSGTAKSKLGVDQDRGKWRVSDADELCLEWDEWVTDKNCYAIHAHGDEHKMFAKEGGLKASFRLKKGNPGKLSVKTPKEDIIDSGAKALTAPEAKAEYSGNSAAGRMPKASAGFVFYFAEDGVAVGRLRSAAGEKLDSGTWRIDDKGGVCLKWSTWDKGEEHCTEVFKKGKRFAIFDDEGDVAAAFKIAKGNSKDLKLPATGG